MKFKKYAWKITNIVALKEDVYIFKYFCSRQYKQNFDIILINFLSRIRKICQD